MWLHDSIYEEPEEPVEEGAESKPPEDQVSGGATEQLSPVVWLDGSVKETSHHCSKHPLHTPPAHVLCQGREEAEHGLKASVLVLEEWEQVHEQ